MIYVQKKDYQRQSKKTRFNLKSISCHKNVNKARLTTLYLSQSTSVGICTGCGVVYLRFQARCSMAHSRVGSNRYPGPTLDIQVQPQISRSNLGTRIIKQALVCILLQSSYLIPDEKSQTIEIRNYQSISFIILLILKTFKNTKTLNIEY